MTRSDASDDHELDLDSELDALEALAVLDTADRDDSRDALHRRLVDKSRRAPERLPGLLAGIAITDEAEATRYSDAIEALATRAAEFADLLLAELRRVRAVCEARPTRATLWALGAFGFLEAEPDPGFRRALLEAQLESARSPSAEVRSLAVDALSGLDFEHVEPARAMLVRLLEDPSWKVRANAEGLLAEAGLLPEGYRAPWADRLRRWWFDWR